MRIISFLRDLLLYSFTVLLIYPFSPQIFNQAIQLKEPDFIMPLYTQDKILIRADAMGEGHFGARRSGGRRRHNGLDIAGYVGEPIAAAKSGIAATGEVKLGMGKYVKISHPDGTATVYGHLSSIAIENRSWVWQGEKIGEVGKTGNANYASIQPHLHFELRVKGEPVDPYPFLCRKGG